MSQTGAQLCSPKTGLIATTNVQLFQMSRAVPLGQGGASRVKPSTHSDSLSTLANV